MRFIGLLLFVSCDLTILHLVSAEGTPKIIDARGKGVSRDPQNGVAFANFKAHKFSYLNITSLATDYVMHGRECGIACVNIPSCFSFNLAVFYDITEKIICELLPSDKYNNSDKFVPSKLFHHFSIRSPCMSRPCLNKATCVSLYSKSSYACLCTQGYTGTHCEEDIDECTASKHKCSANADCINTYGSYNCSCKSGYTGNGFDCADINECDAPMDPCRAIANSECHNTNGSYMCQCKDGYIKNGPVCEDIDECLANIHDCHASATCTNAVGSFTCACNKGYTGDGKSCNDINECGANSHDCHLSATCANTIGSFTCACTAGYTGDGKSCSGSYRVTVTTADVKWAGTAANVTIQIFGDKGNTPVMELIKTTNDPFAQGKSTEFILVENAVGSLTKLGVWRNNDGSYPGWELDKVTVELGNSLSYTFAFNQKIAAFTWTYSNVS